LLLLGGPGLLLGGVGGGVDDEGGGGVFGIVDGVGQVALASITDPSGHVLVVGDVGVPDVDGGVVVDGVNVWVQDGSVGILVQSTGGGVPVVQLPAAHVDPVPFPPDGGVGIDVLVGCIAADVLLGGMAAAPAVVFVRLWAFWVGLGRSLAHFNSAFRSFTAAAADAHFIYAFSGVSGRYLAHFNCAVISFAAAAADAHFKYTLSGLSGRSLAHLNCSVMSFAASAADAHFRYALGSIGGHGPV
jgi:hypothetical protein